MPPDMPEIIRRHSRRARRLWLTVRLDGQVLLTVPAGIAESAVDRFLTESQHWIERQIARIGRYKDHVVLPRSRRDYLTHRETARQLVHATLDRLAARYGRRWRRVAIKDLRRNWGSCSVLGNLNFNYKLVLLPPRLAEYVVFHEVCHLEAFDHSQRFWDLVAREFPDHRALRSEMRKYHP